MQENESVSTAETQAAVQTDITPQTEAAPLRENADSLKKDDFEKLIRGEYKAEFDERVQKIIDKRFREMRSMKEQAARVKPVIDALSEKYGETDIEKLTALLKSGGQDSSEKHTGSRTRTRHALKTFLKWRMDADALKRERADFDLKKEMTNGTFQSLLRAGVDLKSAYAFLHQRENLESAVRIAAAKTRENTLNEMRARMLRPSENGAGGYAGAGMKPVSVMNMTRAEREEIEKRASRGEKVYFS